MWQGFVHRNHPVFVGITQQSDIKSTSQANWIPRIAGLYGKIEEKMERKKKRNGCGRGLTDSVDSDCIP